MYTIKLTQIAAEQLKALDSNTLKQILHKIESLKKEPFLLGKPLQGPLKEYRSLRAAGQRYRIIYRVLDEEIIVIIVAVGIRKDGDKKDIYELMKKYIKTGLLDNLSP
ncbi:type II toxin-antitoxin system RelE family toxin [Gracilinema caldarium]|uniref:Plasmid stabilization system n=1 Tax=Gracilinema caldarium (strain ATCC 51460 / DSM 7334 / H1) TaxID=744872 RepID=F8F0Z6_GRAC1|nr:type II toxin-antitoxin system RelE/ParE family toxin [Gracilinema caldarium]AEJ20282.1 plasmid stabilization system [Gracilinema caldarium DSM 7334]